MPKPCRSGPPRLEKVPTGITGLDEITQGGLPGGRPTLVCGAAGCGKSLLAAEFLVRGAVQYGDPGVLITFEETADDIKKNVASLGFDLDELVRRKRLAIDHVWVERNEIEENGEYDLEGLFIRIGYAIDSIGAKRVVLDTIETLFSGLSNEGILRAELRRLFGWLKDRGLTTVITGERGEGQFTPAGGAIAIRTANPAADTLCIDVEDTGIGFEAANASRIFDAFEQGGREITQQFGGLAISRSIAEMHGGTIEARSDGLNRGATFPVRLPLEAAVGRGADAAGAGGPAPREVRGLRVLLVEDHKDTRTSMERLLRRYHYEVTGAGTAREALAAARSGTFDLVISDLGLPDQNGVELMKRLRDEFGLKGIAVSGYGMEDDLTRSREAGFAHHLTKPVSLDRLRRLLSEVAGDGTGPAPDGAAPR